MKAGRRWLLRGYQIRVDDNGVGGQHVGTYHTCEADGRLMAAAPQLLAYLLAACDALDNVARYEATDSFANEIRAALTSMRLPSVGGWQPSDEKGSGR